jgi:hypothetical protein
VSGARISGQAGRLALRAALGAAAVLAVLGARAAIGARDELGLARRAQQLGDADSAIVHARRAARWHVPLDPAGDEAVALLLALARDAAASGDDARARRAWQAVLAATAAGRSVYVPRCDARAEASRALAQPAASAAAGRREAAAPVDAGDPCRVGAGVFRADAGALGAALALAGLVVAACAAWRLAAGSGDAPGRLRSRARGWLLAAVLGGLAAFALGLALA